MARDTAFVKAYLIETGNHLFITPDQVRDLEDDTYVMAKPLMFHWTLIRGTWSDTATYLDRWCYPDQASAEAALHAFPLRADGTCEPEGWTRHPATGRRRPEGDADREYIDP